tara:strand:+ start:85 stop:891 length:807 start_codon:yes stop_codon:yes gene_type:complete
MVHLDPHKKVEFPEFLTHEECLHIAHILRRDEHKILDIPDIDPKKLYTGITNKFQVYNLLTHPDIRPLNIPDRLFELPIFTPTAENWMTDLWVQCWGNLLHQQQNLPIHTHADEVNVWVDEKPQNPLVACSIYLDGVDPSYTHWNGIPQRNERGTLHIAGMHYPHEVKTNIHTTPRISMAMDIYTNYEEPMRDTKRFMHIKRPVHISEDFKRRMEKKKADPNDMYGHGIIKVKRGGVETKRAYRNMNDYSVKGSSTGEKYDIKIDNKN